MAFGSGGRRSIQLSYGRNEQSRSTCLARFIKAPLERTGLRSLVPGPCSFVRPSPGLEPLSRKARCLRTGGRRQIAPAIWRARQDSNLRPTDSKSGALSS